MVGDGEVASSAPEFVEERFGLWFPVLEDLQSLLWVPARTGRRLGGRKRGVPRRNDGGGAAYRN